MIVGKAMQVSGQQVHRNSLCFLFSFSVNLKLLKNKSFSFFLSKTTPIVGNGMKEVTQGT